MTDLELRNIVRASIAALSTAGPGTAPIRVAPIRAALAKRGLGPGCHAGRTDLNTYETVEWYAGQALDLVDREAWFAINSLINCLDKFVPEVPRG